MFSSQTKKQIEIMKTEPNESASPLVTVIDGNWIKESPSNRNGLTKREYFTGIALGALLSNTVFTSGIRSDSEERQLKIYDYVAMRAVEVAEATINQLNKE